MDLPKLVVHEDDLPWMTENGADGAPMLRRRRLGLAANAERLGCSLIELLPGKRAWIYHYHYGNEEAIYVLGGAGHIRLADGEVPLKAGDYVALPIGREGAHLVINSSGAVLRYLCFSTMEAPDVVVYPDSDKVGIWSTAAPGRPPDESELKLFLRQDPVGYWEGE